MNDYWWIAGSLIFTVALLLRGGWLIAHQRKFSSAAWWMGALLLVQTMALGVRGMVSGLCPIHGLGEVFFFMGWSLNAFYLVLGRTYRLSILGSFTLPAVLLCMVASLVWYDASHPVSGNHWVTWHAGVAMLAYGAFGLSAVAGGVFLVQNELLKAHRLTGLSKILPPVRSLQTCMVRLSATGFVLIICSQLFGYWAHIGISASKWIVAGTVSFGYMVLLLAVLLRGLPGRWMAWASIGLYVLALLIFFVVK